MLNFITLFTVFVLEGISAFISPLLLGFYTAAKKSQVTGHFSFPRPFTAKPSASAHASVICGVARQAPQSKRARARAHTCAGLIYSSGVWGDSSGERGVGRKALSLLTVKVTFTPRRNLLRSSGTKTWCMKRVHPEAIKCKLTFPQSASSSSYSPITKCLQLLLFYLCSFLCYNQNWP